MERTDKLIGIDKIEVSKKVTWKDKLERAKHKPILWLSPVVLGSLVYYGAEYYKKGELVFTKNQFTFYIVFSLIVFGMYMLIHRQTSEIIVQNREIAVQNTTIIKQNKIITVQNEEIIEGQIIIKDLVNMVTTEIVDTREDLNKLENDVVTLHRKTKKLLVQAIDEKHNQQ